MFFTKKRHILSFALDTLALFFVGTMIHLSFSGSQSFLFWFLWLMGTMISLYLVGRYSARTQLIFPHIIKACTAPVPTLLISYPFLNGDDADRTLLLLLLFFLTVITLSLITYTKLHANLFQRKKPKSILFLLDETNNTTRYQDLKTRLQRDGYIINELETSPNIEINQNHLAQQNIVIYGRHLVKNKTHARLLLEEKIKGKKVIEFTTFYSQITGRVPLELIDESYLLNSGRAFFEKKSLNRLIFTIDLLVGSLLFLIFLIPAFIIGIFIRLESKGPIIFKQERVGKNLKPFTLYKFRSMCIDAEKDGPQWATTNDSRATKVGAVLRKTHLDEIPQIINVILGDISLVGPRPIRLHFTQELTKKIPFYHLRNFVKPGLTGWAQINAPRGENLEEEKIKLEMDLYYLQNASIMMNLYIMMGTGRHMITPHDNSHSNSPIEFQAKKT